MLGLFQAKLDLRDFPFFFLFLLEILVDLVLASVKFLMFERNKFKIPFPSFAVWNWILDSNGLSSSITASGILSDFIDLLVLEFLCFLFLLKFYW